MRQRINTAHMRNGVTLIDPESTYIEVGVKIGNDTIIEPNVVLKGNTTIGSDCFVGAGSTIIDSTIEDNIQITSSTIESAIMHTGSNIGPNSHLRPNAEIGVDVHVGNFCEVKTLKLATARRLVT